MRAGDEREEEDQPPHNVLFFPASCSRLELHSPSFVRSASTTSGLAREVKLSFDSRCSSAPELLLELRELGADARALLLEIDQPREEHDHLGPVGEERVRRGARGRGIARGDRRAREAADERALLREHRARVAHRARSTTASTILPGVTL